jgi:predicted dehydrogenase
MNTRTSRATRRQFLQHSTTAGLAAAILAQLPRSSRGRTVAPSEKIVMGMIGAGPRGMSDLGNFLAEPDVRFVAIAELQKSRRDGAKAAMEKAGHKDIKQYADFREMLARPDIDAVLISTGDRWHALASITTAKAGKDMYCEKPFSMTIEESRALADTMKRYGRIYQAGTQRRNIPNFMYAIGLVHSGKLGKIHTLHAHTLEPKTTQQWLPEEPLPPKQVCDWDTWLGPAPWRPYNSAYVQGKWRDHYDFHSGGILEWGSHTVDLCQWANQSDHTTPIEYHPTADGCEARYANGVKLVMRGRSSGWLGLGTCPVRFEGDEGWIETGDSGLFVVSPDSLRSSLRIEEMAGTDPTYHVREFIRCVKTRAQPSANATVAAQSHIGCHAATIAWRLGRDLKFDPESEKFIDDDDANRLRSRAMREPWSV